LVEKKGLLMIVCFDIDKGNEQKFNLRI